MHLEIVPERYHTVLSVLDQKGQWEKYLTTKNQQLATILGWKQQNVVSVLQNGKSVPFVPLSGYILED
jgi:hypothetical protein